MCMCTRKMFCECLHYSCVCVFTQRLVCIYCACVCTMSAALQNDGEYIQSVREWLWECVRFCLLFELVGESSLSELEKRSTVTFIQNSLALVFCKSQPKFYAKIRKLPAWLAHVSQLCVHVFGCQERHFLLQQMVQAYFTSQLHLFHSVMEIKSKLLQSIWRYHAYFAKCQVNVVLILSIARTIFNLIGSIRCVICVAYARSKVVRIK